MPVTINARATWGQYVTDVLLVRRIAMAPPAVSDNKEWNPIGGVFIHHRGPDPISGGGEYDNDEDCRRDIAGVFVDHFHGDFNGDIAYNFVICRHGNVYEGRGYERGEANHAGDVDGLGRNAGFYSIMGLMHSDHTVTEAMLRSFRELIEHLRTRAPIRAGSRILPHSFEHDTECPGNLTMYARQGSTIDPSVPWVGRGDFYVYEAQRWINETYRDVAGYVKCPEQGRTGWPTVLSLTQALQHEHGISPTVQNFGPGTFDAVKARDTMPDQGSHPRLNRIYNGALWCKGYWTSTIQHEWPTASQVALERIYQHAGFDFGDNALRHKLWPHIVKALMRMDQFRLVPGGDVNIQRIQQRLNARYVGEVGIPAMSLVPCDGIYSRDVQKGFMMALQYELGLAPDTINGYFGPATQDRLRSRASGQLTGDLRYLFRAACYFNSPAMVPGDNNQQVPLRYDPNDIGTDQLTATHTAWVRAFQRFSQIPVTGTNDFTTWAQLLVSCGDTARPATGCDCITEITAERGASLYAAGYRIVGRYLDEHLPPTDPKYLGKSLKPGEPQTILNAGLRLLPIFQYNGRELMNFTYQKGYDQARAAHHKAVEHRIPAGTCIYFGVDYDAMDGEIDSHIKPYFSGVKTRLAELGNRYTFGVYGSRNVSSRVSTEVGARWSLVSGMSWGFSGNLGFPLPANWSLNQVREFEFRPGWGLDHDVWRDGADPGVSSLAPEE